jgi:hypothetical protein
LLPVAGPLPATELFAADAGDRHEVRQNSAFSYMPGTRPGIYDERYLTLMFGRTLVSGFHRDFRVPFLTLVRRVAPDRTDVSDAVSALFALAPTRLSGTRIALRLVVHPAFRSLGLLSIRHDKSSH